MFEHLITFQARYRPDAIAIATPVGNATFAGLDADVDRMAHRLQPIVPALGRVAVQVQGSGLHWVVLLALARLGCVSASLPPVGERAGGGPARHPAPGLPAHRQGGRARGGSLRALP